MTFDPAIPAKEVIDIIRQTPRNAVDTSDSGAHIQTQKLYLRQEAADALIVLGSQDDAHFLWSHTQNPPPDEAFTAERTFQAFPDDSVLPSLEAINRTGWYKARIRMQTSAVAGPMRSLAWYSCYLANAASQPAQRHSVRALNVNTFSAAGGEGWSPQAAVPIQAQTEIASYKTDPGNPPPQEFGHGIAVLAVARHEDNSADGKLVGIQSTLSPKGADTGPGNSSGGPAPGSYANYGYAGNSSDGTGFCAFIAKNSEDPASSEDESPGWYNGFVADRDSISARFLWHIGRMALAPVNGPGNPPSFRSAQLAIGHDDPQSSIHATYVGAVDCKLENTLSHSQASPFATVGMFGKGNVSSGAPTAEMTRITANIATPTAGQEDARLNFRTRADGGDLEVVWNLGQGLWSQGAVQTDKGLHKVNVGAATGNASHGYYVAGAKVVGVQRTGWTAWTGSADRASHSTSAASLADVAHALKALIDDLRAHGLIA